MFRVVRRIVPTKMPHDVVQECDARLELLDRDVVKWIDFANFKALSGLAPTFSIVHQAHHDCRLDRAKFQTVHNVTIELRRANDELGELLSCKAFHTLCSGRSEEIRKALHGSFRLAEGGREVEVLFLVTWLFLIVTDFGNTIFIAES